MPARLVGRAAPTGTDREESGWPLDHDLPAGVDGRRQQGDPTVTTVFDTRADLFGARPGLSTATSTAKEPEAPVAERSELFFSCPERPEKLELLGLGVTQCCEPLTLD